MHLVTIAGKNCFPILATYSRVNTTCKRQYHFQICPSYHNIHGYPATINHRTINKSFTTLNLPESSNPPCIRERHPALTWGKGLIVLRDIPLFALGEDIQRLFEENGFEVDHIGITYERQRGFNNGACQVSLKSPQMNSTAVNELNNAVLFDERIRVFESTSMPFTPKPMHALFYGWFASNQMDYAKRGPSYEPVKDIFAPLRERRRVVFSNFPIRPLNEEELARIKKSNAQSAIGHANRPAETEETRNLELWLVQRLAAVKLYKLLHKFDVMGINVYVPKSLIMVDFATREGADLAQNMFEHYKLDGHTLSARIYQISLKHLPASWDSGRPGVHFSGRDQGSAVGTNFEEEQELVFRKAILGKKDRKLYVPSHSYR